MIKSIAGLPKVFLLKCEGMIVNRAVTNVTGEQVGAVVGVSSPAIWQKAEDAVRKMHSGNLRLQRHFRPSSGLVPCMARLDARFRTASLTTLNPKP